MSDNLILVINPGSTSTKIAIFNNDKEQFSTNVEHEAEIIKSFAGVYAQYAFRCEEIFAYLTSINFDLGSLTAVIGRGGYVHPVRSGTYKVTVQMVEDLKVARYGEHASNLGAIIAFEISQKYNIPAFITDPTIVDEMIPLAKITGVPEIKRKSQWHPLNQKACGRRAAQDLGTSYDEVNLIVAHLGGGISIAAHEKGVGIDVNDGLLGDGPFSLERSGRIPTGSMLDLCFQDGATYQGIQRRLLGNSGLVAYCGTTDARKVVAEIKNGNKEFELAYKAMAYNIAKEIAMCAVALKGQVDAIVLTGGLAYDELLTGWIKEYAGFIGKFILYPGGFEMEAMAEAVVRVLNGQEVAHDYN